MLSMILSGRYTKKDCSRSAAMSGGVSEAKEAIVGVGADKKVRLPPVKWTQQSSERNERRGCARQGNGCVIELLQQPAYWVDVTIYPLAGM